MVDRQLLSDLHRRGLVHQVSEGDELGRLMESQSISFYCGFDPTADSLHLGSLKPLVTMMRFQRAGHRPIALVGGATGLVGDPSFKAAERGLNAQELVQAWSAKLRDQIAPFLDFEGAAAARIVNNYDWLGNMGLIEFLRDVGKQFSVSAMLRKDSVRQRLDRENAGMSFAEFSYSLLQGYDFLELRKRHGCVLQLGGSDQWGNILAGVDLIRRQLQEQCFGLTLPLVTTQSGEKFGKTEKGAIWLDAAKTSPFALYQYLQGVTDADVYRYLADFTFLTMEEIGELEQADAETDGRLLAQRLLAESVVELVHGPKQLASVKRIANALFGEDLGQLTADDLAQLGMDGMPSASLETGSSATVIDVMQTLGLARSKSEARQLVASGAVLVNGQRCMNPKQFAKDCSALYDRYLLVRKGKSNHGLVQWEAPA